MSTEDEVFQVFKGRPRISSAVHEVAAEAGLSITTTNQHLTDLYEKGKLVRRRTSIPDEPYFYRLSPREGGKALAFGDGGWQYSVDLIHREEQERKAKEAAMAEAKKSPVPDEILAGREQRFAAQAGVVRKRYRALCIGGPLAGKWHEGNDVVVRAVEPPGPVNLMAYATEDPQVPDFKYHTYEIRRIHMFGLDLWVALDMDDTDVLLNQNTALLRAILQRDVAQAMGL